MEAQLEQVAKVIESQIDDEIEKLDKLEVSDLEAIRRNRIAEMKKRADKKKEWANLVSKCNTFLQFLRCMK